MSYLTGNIFVSNIPSAAAVLPLNLQINGVSLALPIMNATVTIKLTADHQSGTGTISGLLDTASFSETLRQVLGQIDASFCQGLLLAAIKRQIAQASDILSDGTQDPSRTCNGISIGLGFDVARVRIGNVGPAAPVVPGGCL